MSISETIGALPAWPGGDFGEFGDVTIQPLSKMQRLTGSFLTRNWLSIPHVTHHDDLDITDLEARRHAHNAANPDARLSAPVLVGKALAALLKRYPRFNASIDGTGKNLVMKGYCNIGFAVDTAAGLLVAVVRDCDSKSCVEIAAELAALARKARDAGLSMSEMSGGSMTVTSLGHIGGTGFTPIINAPEVAILGLSRAASRAVPGDDRQVVWREMLPVSLSYDHRVINGADAARFVRSLEDELLSLSF